MWIHTVYLESSTGIAIVGVCGGWPRVVSVFVFAPPLDGVECVHSFILIPVFLKSSK